MILSRDSNSEASAVGLSISGKFETSLLLVSSSFCSSSCKVSIFYTFHFQKLKLGFRYLSKLAEMIAPIGVEITSIKSAIEVMTFAY